MRPNNKRSQLKLNFFFFSFFINELINRWQKITGKPPHALIRRGVYYAHRDLELILNCYEKGESFYLYTGRGPSSSSLHVGHMIPFIINKYLQDTFQVPLVIQMTNDEKFFWKDLTWEEAHYLARENAKDIIAFGFDPSKTFIFLDNEYMHYLYPNVCKVQKKVTFKKLRAIFGFHDDLINVGKIAYPAIQAVPAFSSTFPIPFRGKKMRCLIPCAIDQDPYFRLTRDIAPCLRELKTSTIYAKFIPSLKGPGKMNASDPSSAIYLNDSPKVIIKKIKGAFSGGQENIEKQKKIGANLKIDVAFQYLTFFLEDDDKLKVIEKKYKNGEILTDDVKNCLIKVLIPIILNIQKNRENVTDDVLETFMTIRPLNF